MTGMHFLASTNGLLEFVELAIFILGVGIVGVVFWLGTWVSALLHSFTSPLQRMIPIYINRRLVDCIIKGILVIVAFIMGNAFQIKFTDVIRSSIPIEDFNSIAEEFAANPDKWRINVFFNTIMNQMFMSFAFFIPFFGIDLIAGIVETIICREESPSGILDAIIAFAMDVAVILSVNTIVMCSGMTFPRIMYQFLQEIRLDLGIVRWVFLIIAFVLMFYYVVKDLFSADLLLAFLGINTAAMFFDISVTDTNRWILFGVSILFGLISKVIRKTVLRDELESNGMVNVIFGVVVLILTSLLAFGALWLINRFYPSFSIAAGLS